MLTISQTCLHSRDRANLSQVDLLCMTVEVYKSLGVDTLKLFDFISDEIPYTYLRLISKCIT